MARSTDRIGSYHKEFARQIIEQLKEGTAPFQKPWKPGERSLPENLVTSRRYSGGNSLYLQVAALRRGFADPRWATYRQIAAAGGHVRRGQKGTQILFFSSNKVEPAKDDQGNPKLTDSGEPVYTRRERPRPVIRTYTVFNAEQTGGLPSRPPATPPPEWQAHSAADAIIETSGVAVSHQAGDRAYYNVRTDQVVIPEAGQFATAGKYYQTALHELGHATGHPSRLNRATLGKKFGSPEYAKEELRAEISAMMTGEKIGLGHDPRHGTDYIASWIKALEDDPREIYRAAADADRMSRYLMEPARDRIADRHADIRRDMDAHTPRAEQPQRPDHVNNNIGRAATVALDTLNNADYPTPPSQLIRDLQSVHLAAAQNAYTRQTADFRSVVGQLQNYASESLSDMDQRRTVLALGDNFRDPERLDQRLSPPPPPPAPTTHDPAAFNRSVEETTRRAITLFEPTPDSKTATGQALTRHLQDLHLAASQNALTDDTHSRGVAFLLKSHADDHMPAGPTRNALLTAATSLRTFSDAIAPPDRDQVQSPELSQSADHLRAAQYSLDRLPDEPPRPAPEPSPPERAPAEHQARPAAAAQRTPYHPSITLRAREAAAIAPAGAGEAPSLADRALAQSRDRARTSGPSR